MDFFFLSFMYIFILNQNMIKNSIKKNKVKYKKKIYIYIYIYKNYEDRDMIFIYV